MQREWHSTVLRCGEGSLDSHVCYVLVAGFPNLLVFNSPWQSTQKLAERDWIERECVQEGDSGSREGQNQDGPRWIAAAFALPHEKTFKANKH